jgi:hypothetical protein
MARRSRPEDLIQRSVFQHIRARGVPGLVAIHPANGGYRKPVEAKILAGLGVTRAARQISCSGCDTRLRAEADW